MIKHTVSVHNNDALLYLMLINTVTKNCLNDLIIVYFSLAMSTFVSDIIHGN